MGPVPNPNQKMTPTSETKSKLYNQLFKNLMSMRVKLSMQKAGHVF